MAVTSIPKTRLIQLILGDLNASNAAKKYLKIGSAINIEDRLTSFSKYKLLEFITSLGTKGEKGLRELSTAFPIRRPPTLYIAVLEDKPEDRKLTKLLRDAAQLEGLESGMQFEEGSTVRRVFLPKLGVSKLVINQVSVWEIQLQYEHRFEYVESDPDAEDYGQLTYSYSLETAIVWIPSEKYYHAVIACSDYSAVKRIRDFLGIKISLGIYPPTFSKGMMEKITKGASPRSATYTLSLPDNHSEEPQNITVSDPYLESKDQFKALNGNATREQVSGFYTAHPGLTFGGMGVARRDGKIWTPRRLDHKEILSLALSIIKQTEKELGEIDDYKSLASYFYLNKVSIGGKELHEKARHVWIALLSFILSAQARQSKEETINPELIWGLLKNKKSLNVLTAVEYDCPNCGVRLIARCKDCGDILTLEYEGGIIAKCQRCDHQKDNTLECLDCGGAIQIDDLTVHARIFPDVDNQRAVFQAAKMINAKYLGSWIIQGLTLKHISTKRRVTFKRLSLKDFVLWDKEAKLGRTKKRSFSDEKVTSLLNHTLEKCCRTGNVARTEDCKKCLIEKLKPEWILTNRNMCLLRLFGVPINKKFDGIHHGHEFADILYEDILKSSGEKLKIGIHVKSRRPPRPKGMGRSSSSVKGLYTQTVYSAYESKIGGRDLDVIGIAMPNKFSEEVLDSLAYAVNSLGFSFLVIEEAEWQEIMNLSYEQILFDFST